MNTDTSPNLRPPLANEAFSDKRQYSREGIKISLAKDASDMEHVYRLVHDAYLEKGYCEPIENQRLTYFEQLDNIPETSIFLVRIDDEIIGTLSLTEQNPLGEPVDEVFQADYKNVLLENRKTAVIWRLAIEKRYREMPFIVTELIKAVIWTCFERGIQTTISTINQRQERLYQRIFNMRSVAHNTGISDFSHVPCAMIRWDQELCPKRWHPPKTHR